MGRLIRRILERAHAARTLLAAQVGQGIAEWIILLFLLMLVALVFLGSQVSTVLSTVGESVQP